MNGNINFGSMQEKATLLSLLGGVIWNHQGVWQTSGLDGPGDDVGSTYDRFRVLAAAYLYHKNSASMTLLAQGGLATSTKPSIAYVMKEELRALDVPAEAILLEERSYSTFSQLNELNLQSPRDLIILSNEWHLPRIRAMIELLPELENLQVQNPQLVAAEEILLQEDPHKWRAIIDAIRQRKDILARIKKERQGIEQLKAGTYKTNNLDKFF